jgi:hypothetical protein
MPNFITIFVWHNKPFLWGRRHHFGAALLSHSSKLEVPLEEHQHDPLERGSGTLHAPKT